MPDVVMVVTRHELGQHVEFYDGSDLPMGELTVTSAAVVDALIAGGSNAEWLIEQRVCEVFAWLEEHRGLRHTFRARPRCVRCGTDPAATYVPPVMGM